jgi:hypothetical protein
LFGDAFKKILIVLAVLALLAGVAAGVLYGVIPALHYDVWRVEADETPAQSATPSPAPTPQPTDTPEPTATPEIEPETAEQWVERYMTAMDMQEKLGQMVMFGFTGTSDVQNPFRDIWSSTSVGNAILYGSNIKSTNSDGGFGLAKDLSEQIAARVGTDIPPFISIDVEGGSVVRFRWNPQPVSARSRGRRRDADYAMDQVQVIGEKLTGAGINLDIAPGAGRFGKPHGHLPRNAHHLRGRGHRRRHRRGDHRRTARRRAAFPARSIFPDTAERPKIPTRSPRWWTKRSTSSKATTSCRLKAPSPRAWDAIMIAHVLYPCAGRHGHRLDERARHHGPAARRDGV